MDQQQFRQDKIAEIQTAIDAARKLQIFAKGEVAQTRDQKKRKKWQFVVDLLDLVDRDWLDVQEYYQNAPARMSLIKTMPFFCKLVRIEYNMHKIKRMM